MFGAIFNGAIASRVAEAPAALHGKLPNGVDGVIGFLQKSHGQTAAETYLRHAISAATRDIFLGMAVIALAILGILAMVPRKFPGFGLVHVPAAFILMLKRERGESPS